MVLTVAKVSDLEVFLGHCVFCLFSVIMITANVLIFPPQGSPSQVATPERTEIQRILGEKVL